MDEHFVPLTTLDALDTLFKQSEQEPVILFGHDRGCPISMLAYREMARVAGPVPLLDVTRTHDVKQAIAQRTGVRHESPQVIVLRHGKAVWSASHFAVKANAVTEAVRANT